MVTLCLPAPLTVADPAIYSGALRQLVASLDGADKSEQWDCKWEVLFGESLHERQSLNSACDATVNSEIDLVDNEEPAPFAGGRLCKIYNLWPRPSKPTSPLQLALILLVPRFAHPIQLNQTCPPPLVLLHQHNT